MKSDVYITIHRMKKRTKYTYILQTIKLSRSISSQSLQVTSSRFKKLRKRDFYNNM